MFKATAFIPDPAANYRSVPWTDLKFKGSTWIRDELGHGWLAVSRRRATFASLACFLSIFGAKRKVREKAVIKDRYLEISSTLSFRLPSIRGCKSCHGLLNLRHIRAANKTTEAGDLYYRCVSCSKFSHFVDKLDKQDLATSNPRCLCGLPSRRQLSSLLSRRLPYYGVAMPQGMYHICSAGDCDFHEWCRDEEGQRIVVFESYVVTTTSQLTVRHTSPGYRALYSSSIVWGSPSLSTLTDI